MNLNRFYVYAYLDPRKPGKYEYKEICFLYKPIYIGKGTQYRMYDHLPKKGKPYRGCNPWLKSILSKIIKEGKSPIVLKILKDLSEKESFKYEKKYIKEIKKRINGGCLVNFQDGGEGSSPTKETIKKMRNSRLKWLETHESPMLGKKMNKKTRKKMSDNHSSFWTGHKHNEESKNLIRKKHLNKPKLKLCNSYRLVSPDGKEFTVNDGLPNFAKEHNLNVSSLVAVSKGRRNHHKEWKCYLLVEKYNRVNNKYKVINIVTKKTKIITNLRQFCRNNNLHISGIIQSHKGRIKHHKNWICQKLS